MMGVRVGVDLTSIDEVEASVAAYGARYTARIFTARELSDSAGSGASQAASLAARFAAKEAVMKVLRVPADAPEWTEIEIRREPGGWSSLQLSGRASELADRAGLEGWSVSLTHEGRMAAAVVAASARHEHLVPTPGEPNPVQPPRAHEAQEGA